ncbi:unnamed protein product [Parajaminaea phylloscopi]
MPACRPSPSSISPPSSSSSYSYRCNHAGCGKSYGRADHLARHKLNHNAPRLYWCQKCNRSFVRSDLLERHLARHEQWAKVGRAPSEEVERPNKARRREDGRGDDRGDADDEAFQPANTVGPTPIQDTHAHMIATASWQAPTAPSTTAPSATYTNISAIPDPFTCEEPLTSLFVPTDYSAGFDWLFDLDSQPGAVDHQSVSSAATASIHDLLLPTTSESARELPAGVAHRTNSTDESDAFFRRLETRMPVQDSAYDIDPVALHRILLFLPAVSELPASPLFTTTSLRCYLYLFFEKFNSVYPLIHKPTFNASRADPGLLAAMLIIGARYATPACHELAVRISQRMWAALISLDGFHPGRATLPMLQALILTEVFCSRMCSRQQHEMAHLFHNFIVTLARRNGAFSNAVSRKYPKSAESWAMWAKNEERKRINLFAFMIDAQHGALFRHVPALSAFQVQLDVPCAADEWQAESVEQWSFQPRSRPKRFLSALKSCMQPDRRTPGPAQQQRPDVFIDMLILHGLMSVAYDLRWRQQQQNQLLATTSDSSSGADSRPSAWKERIHSAVAMLLTTGADRPDAASESLHSVGAIAQCLLYADILELQIYAGLESVCGQFIDEATFQASQRSVRRWAKTREAGISVVTAARFLCGHVRDEASGTPEEEREGDTLHTQWCIYLSALIVWAQAHALRYARIDNEAHQGLHGASSAMGLDPILPLQGSYFAPTRDAVAAAAAAAAQDHGSPRHAYELVVTLSNLDADEVVDARVRRPPTKSLLEVVAEQLDGSRWELIQEATRVVRKLIARDESDPGAARYVEALGPGSPSASTNPELSRAVTPVA